MKSYKKIVFLIITSFSAINTSFSGNGDTLFIHEALELPVYRSAKADLTGNGLMELINLSIIEDSLGFSDFVLTVNENLIEGKHSYNVTGFVIFDLVQDDGLKEVAVYTSNVNGPDEFIIYRYLPGNLFEIGRVNSILKLPRNATIITETEMMFWTRIDTIRYRPELEFFIYPISRLYDLNYETTVTDDFPLFADTVAGSELLGYLVDGMTVKIIKADISPFCYEDEVDSREMCDWYLFETSAGARGWARLKDFIYKLDLPWRP
jgi:hypothetical protein